MEIECNNWFKLIFGMTETQWIKNPIAVKNVEMGQFELLSIAELLNRIQMQAPTEISDELPEFIIYVRKNDDGDNTYFDTSSLQLMDYDTVFPVMFQVASNFNCQENGSPGVNFRSGNFLTRLMSDSTQGPSASGGAGVGAMLRLSRHLASPINLLQDTPYSEDVTEGKLYSYDTELQTRGDLDIKTVRLGLHIDLPANFDRSRWGSKCLYYEKSQMIDQVFTSTIISPSKKHRALTQNLLYAAYLGTYLSAHYRQTEVLVLTFIGGGCFNNPFDLIVSTIVKAHLEVAPQSNLRRVILPIFDRSRSPEPLVKAFLAAGYPAHLVKVMKL